MDYKPPRKDPGPQPLDRKQKKTSCCSCLRCFGRRESDSSEDVYVDRNEPTELLVEKLVIQRVPVRMFATEDDYLKLEAGRGEKIRPASPKPFENYYSTVPKTDIQTASRSQMRPLEESAISLHDAQVEALGRDPPFGKTKSMLAERQLMSTVLNNLSSLHTLGKARVPKDPLPLNPPKRPPDALVNVPPGLVKDWRKNEQVKAAAVGQSK